MQEDSQTRSEEVAAVIDSLSRNNFPPSETQSTVLQHVIDKLDTAIREEGAAIVDEERAISALYQDINDIHTRIRRLGENVGHIQQRQTRLKTERGFYQALCSPVRLLPSEVLNEIFACCVYCDEPGTSTVTLFNISQVCSHWRSVCLGSPGLWTTLSIDVDRYGSKHWKPPLGELIPWWFRRSNGLPLKFSLLCATEGLSPSVLCGLVPHANCLSQLQIRVKSMEVVAPLLALTREDFPLLQTISLSVTKPPSPDWLPGTFPDLSSSPYLRIVSLHFYSWWETENPILPWGQLTHLKLGDALSSLIWHNCFCQCLNLRSVSCVIDTSDNDILAVPSLPLSYNNLSVLELLLIGCDAEFPQLLQNLIFPSLQELGLFCDVYFGGISIQNLLEGISTNSLRCLSLARVVVEIDQLVQFLATCSSVEKLAIDLPLLDYNALYQALLNGVRDMTSGPLMPNLASFTTLIRSQDDAFQPVSPTPLVDVVVSWRRQLKEVIVTIYAHPEGHIEEYDCRCDLDAALMTRNTKDFAQTLQSDLCPYTYVEKYRPAGFVLTVNTLFGQDVACSLSPLTPEDLAGQPS